MNKNILLTNGSHAEIKYHDPEDSLDSKQLDIVIKTDKTIHKNAENRIHELEKETEKLDLIKTNKSTNTKSGW